MEALVGAFRCLTAGPKARDDFIGGCSFVGDNREPRVQGISTGRSGGVRYYQHLETVFDGVTEV